MKIPFGGQNSIEGEYHGGTKLAIPRIVKTSVIPITTKLDGIFETLVNWIPTKIGEIIVVEIITIFEIEFLLKLGEFLWLK